ncbi:conserved hypothetical protein [Xenorhabdus bovienii str. kraussei Quebec]|uniref:Uncharacterized protein n=1 Tax=Xenorhabdus bovienii str. kraussei Quebec TaxID=1398203 RepID=A0A077PJ07_XENBV|nr:SIR2 family protein [Xenorhabdus bovienii]CDH20686.1 conserved hypothetical protein [Xenorhabdus bovienii str. kraussei Quebec]
MATKRAYYGNDKDLDYLERLFQSANINFLIGSGASLPAISVLGNIEEELQQYIINENETQYSELASTFLKTIWDSMDFILNEGYEELSNSQELENNVIITKSNYQQFFSALEKILTKRRSGLLPKRINLFTTNYDLFLEYAATANHSVVLNDGFVHRKNLHGQMVYDPKSFYRTIYTTGNLYNYSVELPTINILKLHGSLSWLKCNNEIYYNIKNNRFSDLVSQKDKNDWINSHALILPRKEKFKETLLENIYYDLLRTYSNELDKEGTLLLVFGFSFADEHIELLTKKALRNATLKICIFAYNDSAVSHFMDKFAEFTNVEIIYKPKSIIELQELSSIITSCMRN